jgi:hypothetical protein
VRAWPVDVLEVIRSRSAGSGRRTIPTTSPSGCGARRCFPRWGDGTAGPFDPPGTFDELEAELSLQNHAVAARLEEVGVPLRTDFYGPGTDTWPYWERELHRSLPLLLGALRGGRESAHTAAA